jgi:hypothetical protein
MSFKILKSNRPSVFSPSNLHVDPCLDNCLCIFIFRQSQIIANSLFIAHFMVTHFPQVIMFCVRLVLLPEATNNLVRLAHKGISPLKPNSPGAPCNSYTVQKLLFARAVLTNTFGKHILKYSQATLK